MDEGNKIVAVAICAVSLFKKERGGGGKSYRLLQ